MGSLSTVRFACECVGNTGMALPDTSHGEHAFGHGHVPRNGPTDAGGNALNFGRSDNVVVMVLMVNRPSWEICAFFHNVD